MANKAKIETFYRVSIANVLKDSDSDFLDALSSDPNAKSYYFAVCDGVSKVIAYHEELGDVVIDAGSIDEAINEFFRLPMEGGYPEPILKPLIRAAIHNDTAILADAFEKETFRFYSVSELDEVADYKSRIDGLDAICGFGAVSHDIDVYFDLDSLEISYGGETVENLSNLHGYFDEDSWVVVLRPYQSANDNSSESSKEIQKKNQQKIDRFCTECGASLVDSAKFCASCGTKLVRPAPIEAFPMPEFEKTSITNSELKVNISGLEVVGPDEDKNYSITAKYTVSNDTEYDLLGLTAHVVLLNGENVLLEERSTTEESLLQGSTTELEAYFWVASAYFGEDVESLAVIIKATGYAGMSTELKRVALPSDFSEICSLPPEEYDNKIRLLSGSVWKSPLDRNKGVDVNFKFAIQNLTDDLISEVRLNARVVGKDGDELINLSSTAAVLPASLVTLTGRGYENNEALESSQIEYTILHLWPIAETFTMQRGATLTVADQDDLRDSDTESSFDVLAATLGHRNPKSSQGSDASIETDRIPCNGSFELQVYGLGGETVIGTISKKQFDYWKDRSEDLANHLAGEEEVPDELGLLEWSDRDDIAHCCGAEFTAESSRISVMDANGSEIWSVDADQDLLIESGVEVEVMDEMAIYQLEPGYYFCGRAFEKGMFFSASVDATEFDPKKLKFVVSSVNEWLLLEGIYYDGEELDGSDGYSTSTKSSEFFVEESES